MVVKVVDQGRVLGEGGSATRGVPAYDLLSRVGSQVEIEHLAVVLHFNQHLIRGHGVGYRECGEDIDLAIRTRAEERADHSLRDLGLLGGFRAAQVVVEDAEERGRVDMDRHRGAA